MKKIILALGLWCGVATAEPLRVALTFDDSLKDHALIAAPMLEERGWRGVFNIITDKVGAGERYMTWEDIRGLLARGHEVTTHTMTHPNLVKLIADGKADVARAELVGSVEAIRKNTGFTPVYMCSPGIAQNEATEKLCREVGLIQMSGNRYNFGEGNEEGVRAVIEARLAKGAKFLDILHHGVSAADHGGWRPFRNRETFAKHLDAIATLEKEGKVVVTDYRGMVTDCPLDLKAWPHHGKSAHSGDGRFAAAVAPAASGAFERPGIPPVTFDRPNGAPTVKQFRTGRPEQAMPFGAGNLSGMVSFGVDSLEAHLSKADYLVPPVGGRGQQLVSPGHLSIAVPDLGTNFTFRQTMDMEHGEVRVELGTDCGEVRFALAGDRETGALVIDVKDTRPSQAAKRIAYDCTRVGAEKTTAALEKLSAGWRLTESDPKSGRFYATEVRCGDAAAAAFRVEIVSAAARDAETANARAEEALDALGRTGPEELAKRRRAWWADYWSRGWIHLEGDERATFLERCWYVNLYSWANVGYGEIPPKFNGGPGLIYDDSRCWGSGLWYQNTRELIWPCCAAGHPEFAKSILLFYDSFLAETLKRMKAKPTNRDALLGGVRLWETTPVDMSPWANTNAATARPDWRRPYVPVSAADRATSADRRRKEHASFTSHVFSSGVELLQQMFDYVRFTGDESFEPVVASWLREQTELYLSLLEPEDDGLYHIHCTNVNESWWKKDDSIVDLAAARFCLAETVAFGGRFGFPAELIADAESHLEKLAPYPTLGDYKYKPTWVRDVYGVTPGDRIWQPYRSLTNGTQKSNCEYNQLYLVFPFAMAHADAPDGDPVRARAIATYWHLPEARNGGWGWSPVAIDAVRLHLTNAADVVYSHARSTCAWPFGGGKSPASPLYKGCRVEDAPYFDGMGVVQTGIQEMLLQSHAEEPDPQLDKGGELKLIPDVPKTWSGAFHLHARGGVTVDCTFEQGKVTQKRLTVTKRNIRQ